MCDKVETVKGFCYLGNRLNANGGCEAAVTARIRLGWKEFREYGGYCLKKILFVDERKGIYEVCLKSNKTGVTKTLLRNIKIYQSQISTK